MDYTQIYADFLKQHFNLKRPLKVVCDSSNGSTGLILQKLQGTVPNLELILLNDNPDPEFPAHGPNPLHEGATDEAAAKVKELNADFGAIFDADGDRAFFVDNTGSMLPSYMTSILLFKHNKPPYVADELVYQSLVHTKEIPADHLRPCRVGVRFIKEMMKEHNGSTGGEFSGHYYFREFFGADSGLFAMIQVANMISTMTQTLAEFRASLVPQELVNEEIKLGDKKSTDILAKVEAHYTDKGIEIGHRDGLTLDFGDTWLSVRASNTEPILRLIGGSPNKGDLAKVVAEVKSLI